MQTHTNTHALTASQVAMGPLYGELSTFPWWACRPCGPRRCQDEVGAKIDCKCWIIQPIPPPFEWVSSVTFRRAFIAKQEKIILHWPPWRPGTSLTNETKHLQTQTHRYWHKFTNTRKKNKTPDTHMPKVLLTLISQSRTNLLANFQKHSDPLQRITQVEKRNEHENYSDFEFVFEYYMSLNTNSFKYLKSSSKDWYFDILRSFKHDWESCSLQEETF